MKRLNAFIVAALVLSANVFAKDLTVNLGNSELKWTGKKVTGEHFGFIKLKSGTLQESSSKITGGEFVIDMTSITVTDLEDEEYNKKLVGHLKSDDFFGTENYPEAKLIITKGGTIKEGLAQLKADLTIKGKTHPVEFTATKSGSNYKAVITVDRTLYNVRYGSGKFFDNLGDKTIYDEFTLEVSFVVQ